MYVSLSKSLYNLYGNFLVSFLIIFLNVILNSTSISTGCDWCAAGGYHGNGQCNSKNHTSLFLCKMATLQWQVM